VWSLGDLRRKRNQKMLVAAGRRSRSRNGGGSQFGVTCLRI
jgi:hypothetical protein